MIGGRFASWAGGALAVAALVAGFYWKLTFTDEFVWFDHPDMAYLELPRLEFQAREMHRGRVPLWDPHIWMGQPLVGQTQPGPVNPLNILMMLWPLDDAGYLRVRVLNVYFVVLHVIAGLGLYLLCRQLKRSVAASVLAACAFALGGFTGSAPWLDVLCGAIWTPWVALFFVRGNLALTGLALGLSWLSGHHEIPLLTSIALIVAMGFRLRAAATRLPRALGAAGAFAVAGMVSAIQMWPTIEFGRLAMRWGPAGGPVGWKDRIPYLSSAIYSFTPRGLFGIVFPDQGTSADSSVFMGVVAVSLAAVGLIAAWRHGAVRWLAALGAASLVYAMGEFTPVHGVLNALLPMLDKARVPVRALHLFNFAAAVLVAFGWDRLTAGGRLALRWIRRVAACLALAGACILMGTLGWKVEVGDALLLSAFISLGWLGLILARASARHRWLFFGFAMLFMMAELNTTLTRAWFSRFTEKGHVFAGQLMLHRDIVEFLRREPGLVRVRVSDTSVPVNFGDLHSIDMQEGYTAGVTTNLLRFGRHTAPGRRIFAVTHFVGREPELPGWIDAFEGSARGIDGHPVKVFRNPAPLARARSVHEVEALPTNQRLAARIDQDSFDPARTALFLGSETPTLEVCSGGDDVQVVAYAPNRVRIEATMQCRGLVILADTNFPGWEARIDDGPPTRIWEVYGGLRGVVVNAGRHEIDFSYRPRSVMGGAVLTAAGLVLTLIWTIVSAIMHRRTRRTNA